MNYEDEKNSQPDSLCRTFECYRYRSAEKAAFFPVYAHRHYFCEVLLVREGNCRITRKRILYHLKPGDLIYIAPMTEHSVDSENGEPVVFDVVKYSPTQLREIPVWLSNLRRMALDAEQLNLPVYMKKEDVEEYHVGNIVEEIIQENGKQRFACDLAVRALLYLLITNLARFWLEKREHYFTLREQKPDPILAVPAYIEQHISEPLKVEEIAAHFDMSYPWFAKRFRDYFGLSCKQFIERIRIDIVEQYLVYTEMDLIEISRNTGFSDCSHMVKDFRRMRDMTPGQYRSLAKSEGRVPLSRFSSLQQVKKDAKA